MGVHLDDQASLSFNPFTLHLQIDDFAVLDDKNATQLSLKHAHFNISWLDFFQKSVVLESSSIESLHLNVVRTKEQLVIGGITQPQNSQASPESASDTKKANTEALVGWLVKIPQVEMKDLVIKLSDLGQSHRVVLNHFSLNHVQASLTNFDANIALDAAINQGKINFSSKLKGTLKQLQPATISVENTLKVNGFALQDWQYLMPMSEHKISEISALINLEIAQFVTLNNKLWKVEQPRLSLAINDAKLLKPDLDLTNKSLVVELNNFVMNGNGGLLQQASGELMLNVNNSRVTAMQQTVAALDTLSIPQSSFSIDERLQATADINQITLKDILFSQPQQSAAIYHNDALIINGVNWKNNHLSIHHIALDKFKSEIVLNADKALANLVLPKVKQDKKVVKQAPVDTTNPSEQVPASFVTVSLDKFELTSPSKIYFTDQSVKPEFKQQISLDTLAVAQVDSRDSALMSPFDVALSFDEHSTATVNGSIAPFGDKLNMKLNVDMRELSLPPLSAYLRTVLGFDFLSGQLDNTVELTIKDDELDGETVIGLRGFELASGNDNTDLSANDGTAIGLNSALSMLKDSQGNVSLTVPLSGNISDPSFGISNVITLVAQKAIMSQAKAYLINTFVPYANIVTVASVAGEYLLRLEMNDLEYQAGQIALSPEQQPFVEELGKLLADKPEQQVKMCGVASRGEVITEGVSDEKIREELKALSQKRGANLKQVLIDSYDIESARLLLCAPKFDSDSAAKPRIEFSF